MYIIYNNDGSVKKINLTDYIQKGNDDVNSIFLGIEGKTNLQWAATVYFTLPTGDVVDPEVITPTTATQDIDGVTYSGWEVSIPAAVTAYEGIVTFSLSVSDLNDHVLFTYEGKLVINPSSVVPNETRILLSQYQSLLNLVNQKNAITSSIVVVNNISSIDLDNYNDGQIFYDSFSKLYYEKDSSLTPNYKLYDGYGSTDKKTSIFRIEVGEETTLQEIEDIAGYDRLICVRYDDKDYFVYFNTASRLAVINVEFLRYWWSDEWDGDDYFSSVFDDEPETIATKKYVDDEISDKMFDGDITVTYPTGSAKIESANLPSSVGCYRLIYRGNFEGILIVTEIANGVINGWGFFDRAYFSLDNHDVTTDYSIYSNATPLKVKPNPTLEGTETLLKGLQLGGNKYAINGFDGGIECTIDYHGYVIPFTNFPTSNGIYRLVYNEEVIGIVSVVLEGTYRINFAGFVGEVVFGGNSILSQERDFTLNDYSYYRPQRIRLEISTQGVGYKKIPANKLLNGFSFIGDSGAYSDGFISAVIEAPSNIATFNGVYKGQPIYGQNVDATQDIILDDYIIYSNVQVSWNGSYYYVSWDNLPRKSGNYALVYNGGHFGLMEVQYSTNSWDIIAITGTRVYQQSIRGSSGDFEFISDNYYEEKRYKHIVKFSFSYTYTAVGSSTSTSYTDKTVQLSFYSNIKTQFSSLTDKYYLGKALAHPGKVIFYSSNYLIAESHFSIQGGSVAKADYPMADVAGFIWVHFGYFSATYPGATPELHSYDADSIDLTTGKMKSRTNKISNSTITIVSDTVTEL